MLRISNSLTSASLSAIFTGLEGRSALKLSRPVTLKQTNTRHTTDEAPAATFNAIPHKKQGLVPPHRDTHFHTHRDRWRFRQSGFWDGFLVFGVQRFKCVFRFFLVFANRGPRSSCSEHKARSVSSAAVTDGWKVWAEYSEQNHIRAATPSKAAVVRTSANGGPSKWGHRPI